MLEEEEEHTQLGLALKHPAQPSHHSFCLRYSFTDKLL